MPSFSTPSTSTSGPPIMKSVWTVESLKPSASRSASLDVVRPLDGLRDPLSVGDVTGGILVEQRVEEDDPGLPDAGLTVHERDLAEVVGARRRSASPRGRRRPPPWRPPPRRDPRTKRSVRSRTICPLTARGIVERTTPSVRRRCGVVKTSSVGMLTTWGTPSRLSSAPVSQRDSGISPTVRSVPGPRNRIVSNRRSSSRAARSRRRPMCSCQAATGSGSSSRVAIATASQRRSTSGVAEDRLRPAGVGVADDRPGDLAIARRLEDPLRNELRARLRDSLRVEIGEELRLRVSGDRDRRTVGRRELVDQRRATRAATSRACPRAACRILEPADVGVDIDRLDVPRAARVCDLGDRAHERKVLRVSCDSQELPRLEVDADLDGEAGVAAAAARQESRGAHYIRGMRSPPTRSVVPW